MEINQMITTLDTNTEGGPTRIVTSGVPRLKGASVSEKMAYFKANYDSVRDKLLNHPRGYPGMFGAILTEPVHPEADAGVFFMNNTGYLNMCVHSAVGVAAACLETGMITPGEEQTHVKLDTPAGLIKLKAEYRENRLGSIAIEPGPALVHTPLVNVALADDVSVSASLAFSAVLFIMIDVIPLDMHVDKKEENRLRSLAVKAIETVSKNLAVAGDDKKAPSVVDLAFLYEDTGDNSCISAVFSKAGVLDQSPCGAGTAAKIALACQNAEFQPEHMYTNVNMFGRKFKGRLTQTMKPSLMADVYTEISGSAQITGFHQFTLY